MRIQISLNEDEYNKVLKKSTDMHLSLSSTARMILTKDCDQFYVALFETLKTNFNDDIEYNGRYIKLVIDGMITRSK